MLFSLLYLETGLGKKRMWGRAAAGKAAAVHANPGAQRIKGRSSRGGFSRSNSTGRPADSRAPGIDEVAARVAAAAIRLLRNPAALLPELGLEDGCIRYEFSIVQPYRAGQNGPLQPRMHAEPFSMCAGQF